MYKWKTPEEMKKYPTLSTPDWFVKPNGFTKIMEFYNPYLPKLKRILETGRMPGRFHEEEYISRYDAPFLDHARLYKNPETGVTCLVYFPYQEVKDIKKDVCQWAESRGLKAKVYKYSWYHEWTCMVVISLPDVNVVVQPQT